MSDETLAAEVRDVWRRRDEAHYGLPMAALAERLTGWGIDPTHCSEADAALSLLTLEEAQKVVAGLTAALERRSPQQEILRPEDLPDQGDDA